ncbi:Nitroreductase [Parelusimicrobium proximum]|uniref:SagB/ThcOx family dehydrogenase n=1 Tax=Parelusimicrobium proximum TaxID=3228953 RepID=UPI003D172F28
MKKLLVLLFLITFIFPASFAKEAKSGELTKKTIKTIKLKDPQKKAGIPIMQALSERKSVRSFSERELGLQTLSNLLWAAVGVNRADGKRTAPTARNKQEIDVYACLKDGAYFYNAQKHILEFVSEGDCRVLESPVTLLIVINAPKDYTWGYVDAGIVSQNISLFASGTGLATVARGSMPTVFFSKMLGLKENQQLVLNHPVGYAKEDTAKAKK